MSYFQLLTDRAIAVFRENELWITDDVTGPMTIQGACMIAADALVRTPVDAANLINEIIRVFPGDGELATNEWIRDHSWVELAQSLTWPLIGRELKKRPDLVDLERQRLATRV